MKKKEKLLIDSTKCSNCGHSLTEGSKFCSECGKSTRKKCSNCGNLLENKINVCNECGYNMTMEESLKIYIEKVEKILNEQTTTSQTKQISLLANKKGEVYRTSQTKVDPKSEINRLPSGGSMVVTKSADESKKSKNKKPNPWAICTSSVGRKDMEKYEKCVQDVKHQKSKKKSKMDEELQRLEEYIERIITDSEINPKIKKGNLKQFVSKLK